MIEQDCFDQIMNILTTFIVPVVRGALIRGGGAQSQVDKVRDIKSILSEGRVLVGVTSSSFYASFTYCISSFFDFLIAIFDAGMGGGAYLSTIFLSIYLSIKQYFIRGTHGSHIWNFFYHCPNSLLFFSLQLPPL